MWCIEGYRGKELEVEVELPRLSVVDVRKIMRIQDDLPIEPYNYQIVDESMLNELRTYGDGVIQFDPDLAYFLAFYS